MAQTEREGAELLCRELGTKTLAPTGTLSLAAGALTLCPGANSHFPLCDGQPPSLAPAALPCAQTLLSVPHGDMAVFWEQPQLTASPHYVQQILMAKLSPLPSKARGHFVLLENGGSSRGGPAMWEAGVPALVLPARRECKLGSCEW